MADPSLYAQIHQLTERLETRHYAGTVDGWRGRAADLRIGLPHLVTAACLTVLIALGALLPLIVIAIATHWDPFTGAGAWALGAAFVLVVAWMIGSTERQRVPDDAIRADFIKRIAALAEEGLSAAREAAPQAAPEPVESPRRRWLGGR